MNKDSAKTSPERRKNILTVADAPSILEEALSQHFSGTGSVLYCYFTVLTASLPQQRHRSYVLSAMDRPTPEAALCFKALGKLGGV